MAGWSIADMTDQSGRTFVVTGANSGLGAHATRALIDAGASVIMACRNTAKADALAATLGPRASVSELDLADLSSVQRFAATVDPFDVLINNAGVMALPARRTVDGFDMQMGTNHLGHFALTARLLPKVSDRVVTLSSALHRLGRIDLDDLNWRARTYKRWQAYGDSKLANLMFGLSLAARFEAVGDVRRSVIVHPGWAATELQGHTESLMDPILRVGNLIAQSAAQGALPTLYAATAPEAANGAFYGPSRLFGSRGAPGISRRSSRADDRDASERLWSLSEQLTSLRCAIE